MSGIVLLLPHGYEGQGPEHSSARLERFLQLCAENNLQVCNPTHPAQYFHAAAAANASQLPQAAVLMTPKSLLRDERSASPLADFTEGSFRLVIDDPAQPTRDRVQRLVLCSGHVFYALQAARDEQTGRPRRAGARRAALSAAARRAASDFRPLSAGTRGVWAQEEPRNMGAWSFIEPRLRELLPDGSVLTYQGRDEAASPATGHWACTKWKNGR